MAWKSIKKALDLLGQDSASPRDTFRKAAKEKIISDPEIWFEFQMKRNLAVHTYRQENIESIVEIFDIFSAEFKALILKIEELDI